MKNVPGTLQEGGAPFPLTRWSIVLEALQSQAPETAQDALADLCQAYWPPIYTFLRRQGRPPGTAQDLTQAFFEHLLTLNTLSRARQEKGRLRTFLLGSLQNFLGDQRDREQTLKRGGGKQIVSINDSLHEVEAAAAAATGADELSEYDRVWAVALMRQTWERLRQTFVGEGKEVLFDSLKSLVLNGAGTPVTQEEVSARLGMPPATLRTHLHRLRGRYRDLLRTEVERTVNDPGEIDAEMHYLFRLLTS